MTVRWARGADSGVGPAVVRPALALPEARRLAVAAWHPVELPVAGTPAVIGTGGRPPDREATHAPENEHSRGDPRHNAHPQAALPGPRRSAGRRARNSGRGGSRVCRLGGRGPSGDWGGRCRQRRARWCLRRRGFACRHRMRCLRGRGPVRGCGGRCGPRRSFGRGGVRCLRGRGFARCCGRRRRSIAGRSRGRRLRRRGRIAGRPARGFVAGLVVVHGRPPVRAHIVTCRPESTRRTTCAPAMRARPGASVALARRLSRNTGPALPGREGRAGPGSARLTLSAIGTAATTGPRPRAATRRLPGTMAPTPPPRPPGPRAGRPAGTSRTSR